MEEANQAYDKEKVLAEAAKIFAASNKKTIKDLSKFSSDLVIKEMERTIDLVGIDSFVEGKFLPYADACVILAFSGKEINRKNIEKLLKASDIVPDNKVLDLLETLRYKNHVIYLNAVYMLLVLGRDPTEESVARIVSSMDVHPDPEAVKSVMNLYKSKISKAWG